MRLAVERVDYESEGLTEAQCPAAPLSLLREWIAQAIARHAEHGDVPEPTAMAVATVNVDQRPDVRTVLMRDLDERGPAFFTNTDSTKGRALRENPAIALALTWPAIHRAVRLQGEAEPLPEDEVTAYFRARPWDARVGAHASAQSRPAPDRAALEAAYRKSAERWRDTGEPDAVPVPKDWGGYRVVVDRVELWAGRPSRLHDRIVWERTGDGGLDDQTSWRRSRLMP